MFLISFQFSLFRLLDVSLERMILVGDLYLSFMVVLLFRVTSTQAGKLSIDTTSTNSLSTTNMTSNGNGSLVASFVKNPLDQSKNIIHDAFAKMDRGTLIRATIVLAGITCLILMYIGVKSLL